MRAKNMTFAYWHSLLECDLHFRNRSRVNHMLLFIHYLAQKYAIVFFYLCVCVYEMKKKCCSMLFLIKETYTYNRNKLEQFHKSFVFGKLQYE